MARKRDRIFAATGAAVFFISSGALTFMVIYTMMQDDGKKDDTANTETSQNNISSKKMEGTMLDNFTPISKIGSLQKIDLQPGSGAEVKASDTVTVDYTGAVAATGKIFQSSLDTGQPVSFALNQVIKGWQDGIPGMKVDGKRRLLIPADQAYGATPPSGSGIPANADLVFDVTLHKIGQ
ncbi:MAG TPA: FKBP-type peptidyl-prolyl cis-trans isomerase [Nevskiaceae bacterium]|nr:FKBP-type peptidyl-prolyl cis-trans isomerase [Nevskiaceae bacterium]